MDDHKVKIDESFEIGRKHFFNHIKVVREIRGVCIEGFQAGEMLSPPVAFVAYSYLVDLLQAQAFFPHRDCDPEGALVILETISTDPSRS